MAQRVPPDAGEAIRWRHAADRARVKRASTTKTCRDGGCPRSSMLPCVAVPVAHVPRGGRRLVRFDFRGAFLEALAPLRLLPHARRVVRPKVPPYGFVQLGQRQDAPSRLLADEDRGASIDRPAVV